jgi:hypothetical protein
MAIEKSITLVNTFGREVKVDAGRKEYLMKQGFPLPTDKPAKKEEPAAADEAAELENMTKKELVQFAADALGIELNERDNKDELIEAILNAD